MQSTKQNMIALMQRKINTKQIIQNKENTN